jgi:ABC-2 type transport system ATP-binding protein
VTALIRVENLVKTYRKPKRFDGPFGALRTLVTRQYDEVRAVDGVSFSIERGELVGYLGPNGAGKSSTIKMMSGVLVPTSGGITVNGLVPWQERERNALQIGVVFGQRSQLWWDLPLVDSFTLIGKLYRMSPQRYKSNLDEFIELLNMGSYLDRPARQLSLGQRMRGDLVAAMLPEPTLLFLDEPTIGLDTVAKTRMRKFVQEMNAERGTTIVLTTHDLADVESLCERVVFIDHGRVVYDADVDGLKRRYAPHRMLVVEMETAEPLTLPQNAPGEIVEQQDTTVRIRFESATTTAAEMIAAVTNRCQVRDLRIEEPDLESVVRRFYAEREKVS